MSRFRIAAAGFLAALLASATVVAAEPTAREIVQRAVDTSGGRGWLEADTNVLKGEATLCRGGAAEKCVRADRYEMYRVYPRELDAAHAGSGKFRLDAYVNGRVLFQTSFDGQRSYDQNGPLPAGRAAADEANAYGFSAIRFALEDRFKLERLADDDVEGHAAYFVRVTDPSGSPTIFGIDKQDGSICYVGWKAPRGWHHRIYSEFYWVKNPGFRQPGRVRLYYDGVKTADILWKTAEINTKIPDETFVLGQPAGAAAAGAAAERR